VSACFLAALLHGCSIKRFAVNQLGDALAESGASFSSDNDPDLIKAAAPFSLKLIESLLAESPEHRGLLLAATSGFTQFAYAFVQQEAEKVGEEDLAAADALYGRAKKLYARARDYGLRGLEARHDGFAATLQKNPKDAVRVARKTDVPLLFWTAAAWGSLISISKDDPAMIADQLIVEALIDRALQLDERFDRGAIHAFLISYEMARQGVRGDPAARARQHFERAMELSEGQLAAPLVSLAEAVCVEQQNRSEFEALLKRALAIDAEAIPEARLANLITQRRARWLLSRTDDLFLATK
jgi:predicted anti-sigma-YlaC factor YlaD